MKHERQHYALDENKNIINAKNALKNQKYFCYSKLRDLKISRYMVILYQTI